MTPTLSPRPSEAGGSVSIALADPPLRWAVNSCLRPDDPLGADETLVLRAEEHIGQHGGELVHEAIDDADDRELPWVRRPQVARLISWLGADVLQVDAVLIVNPSATLHVGDLLVARDVLRA